MTLSLLISLTSNHLLGLDCNKTSLQCCKRISTTNKNIFFMFHRSLTYTLQLINVIYFRKNISQRILCSIRINIMCTVLLYLYILFIYDQLNCIVETYLSSEECNFVPFPINYFVSLCPCRSLVCATLANKLNKSNGARLYAGLYIVSVNSAT